MRDKPLVPQKNALEWSVFAVSLVVVLGILGLLGKAALRPPAEPPNLGVSVRGIQFVGGKSLVEIEVQNRGGETAQGVGVSVGWEKQQAIFTLDFVPHTGKKSGFAVFEGRAQKDKVVARVLGFS